MKKIYIVYTSYPYSEDPKRTSDEIKGIAQLLMDKFNDLVLLIPHFVFDAIWDFPEGYTHPEISLLELALISRCDIFAYDPKRVSSGVRWEKSFAEYSEIPVLTYDELMQGVRP